MRIRFLSCLMLLVLACGPVHAAEPVLPDGAQEPALPAADAQAIEAVIRAQLAAFAKDDARKAFSYAAPGIRRMFRTPENFLAMVRTGYPVVYRPAAVIFLRPSGGTGTVIQPVRMADGEGTLWIAVYLMQRQADGSWLTNGCRLKHSEGQVT